MKKIVYILLLTAATLLASCSKDSKPVSSEDIIGTWTLMTIDGNSCGELSVWITLSESTFDIYQRASSKVFYDHYTGTWSISNGILSGKYTDGTPWADTYKAEISDKIVLSLTGITSGEVSIYNKSEIYDSFFKEVKHE